MNSVWSYRMNNDYRGGCKEMPSNEKCCLVIKNMYIEARSMKHVNER